MAPFSIRLFHVVLWLGITAQALAQVTVYYQQGQTPLSAGGTGTATATGAAANYTGAAAYNPTVLNAPPVPSPFNTQFALQVQAGGTPAGASIPQEGSFLGFSIEMSVVNQVLGTNASVLQVPFLNLMANIQQRVGRVKIRVGGNTQETAVLVDSTPDGKILEKDINGASNPTQTPPLVFTPELLYMLRNISSLVDVRWYLGKFLSEISLQFYPGVPFNDTSNFRLAIAEQGQTILGDYLIGLQAGNEPDLYARHGHRATTYGPYDYFGEFGNLIQAMNNDANAPNRDLLIGPSIATGDWKPEDVWNTGFIDAYTANLAYASVENYPADNCFAQFGVGSPVDPQTEFPNYLNHNAGKNIINKYLNSTAYLQTKNKKLLMFETNTASCGGFPGISDSFGAALWGIDYTLQMAYSNFSGALMHVGGQSVYYNPFTPPPTNQSSFHQWTIGPIYYSALIVAETLGPTNGSQVLDLNANNGDINTPAYVIYENGNPVRVAIVNFVTDTTGANNLNVGIQLSGGTPSQVKVKYLLASSVAQKYNFTWAGQTFGDIFSSDGRPVGEENITTIACDTTNGVCNIPVPAPSYALVFLTDDSLSESEGGGGTTTTFATTFITKTRNTATVDPAVLATSNGHSGMGVHGLLGSTSAGSISSAESAHRREVIATGIVVSFATAALMIAYRVF